jgi:hypothetical protein
LRDFEHQQRERECQYQPDDDRSPRHRPAVLTDDEGNGDDRGDAERGLERLHESQPQFPVPNLAFRKAAGELHFPRQW